VTLMKKQKKGLAIFTICLMVGTGLAFLGSLGTASAAEVFKARYSYHWFPAHHLAIYSEKFAQLSKEDTKGRLDVTTYPSGQLYGARDAIAAVSQGSVEMAGCIAVTLASAAPEFGMDSLMMLFDSYEQQRRAWGTEPGKAVIAKMEQRLGVKLLCRFPNGPACPFTSGKKVQNLEDFKGLKARLISPSEKPFWEALGVSTVSMSTEQVYTSMQQGMINAIWTIPTAIKSYSWWDFIKYGTLPYIAYPDSFIVANAKWWTSLPQDVRDTVSQKIVPRIEKESTDFVMDDAKAILEEFVKQKGGTMSALSAHDIKTLKEICVEKVYPVSTTKYDPAFWGAIAKEQGLKK
jgi:TRAP-type C4-dicarboxylate transport system substrate-binding protein